VLTKYRDANTRITQYICRLRNLTCSGKQLIDNKSVITFNVEKRSMWIYVTPKLVCINVCLLCDVAASV
jgi:hypothetical protein